MCTRLPNQVMCLSMKKPRVLLTGKIDFALEEWNALSDVATLEVCITSFESSSHKNDTLITSYKGGGFYGSK